MRHAIRYALAGLLLVLSSMPLAADDSAASVAVGGIVLTREPRISMEKERLTISQDKVIVEFEFLNESDEDITTEVAFPIPDYKLEYSAGGTRDFEDFKLWIDGKELKYQVEAKAFVGKRDVSALLDKYKVDISSLGHYDDSHRSPDFLNLSPEARKILIGSGAFDNDDGNAQPLWKVRKKYHWTQVFPAHKMLHIRHEYTPAFGFEQMQVDAFDEASSAKVLAEDKKSGIDTGMRADVRELKTSCVDPSLQKAIFLEGNAANKPDLNHGYVVASWVDYILTTANSWKVPIKDFKLVIDKGPLRSDLEQSFVSLCWDGPVTKVDAQHYEAVVSDFVPRKELHVLFLSVTKADPDEVAMLTGPLTSTKGVPVTPPPRRRIYWVVLLVVSLPLAFVWWGRRRRI